MTQTAPLQPIFWYTVDSSNGVAYISSEHGTREKAERAAVHAAMNWGAGYTVTVHPIEMHDSEVA